MRTFVIVVALCRALRYSLIAILAEHYGRHFVRAVRHPGQYWGWMLLFAAIVMAMVAMGVLIKKQLEAAPSGR